VKFVLIFLFEIKNSKILTYKKTKTYEFYLYYFRNEIHLIVRFTKIKFNKIIILEFLSQIKI